MKRRKIFFYLLSVAVLTSVFLMLVGCQQTPAVSEKTDTQVMQEAFDKTGSLPYYVLIVGNDSRKGTTEIKLENYSDGTGRSDTMMLARIDPETFQVTLVTVPRDTQVAFDGTVTKINEVYRTRGIDATLDEVEKLTGIRAKYYLDMGFVEFDKFITEIGGVTANVPLDMNLKDIIRGDKIYLNAGTQKLSGAETLVLARTRKAYAGYMEAVRQIQDRQIVEVGIKQVAADPINAAKHANTLLTNMKTDWPADELSAEIASFVANADKIKVLSGTGPYEGDFMEEYAGVWMVPRDETTWKQLMKTVDMGGDPTTIVRLPEVAAA